MGEHTVKRDPTLLVGIEPLEEEVPQKASVLRDAFTMNANDGRYRLRIMLGVRGEVAHGGKAEAGDHGVLHHVHVLVDLAGRKAALQVNVAIAGLEFAIDHVRELPL